MREVWKDINGYEGIYQVSNLGHVRKTKTLKPISISLNTTGYEQVNLDDGSIRKKPLVHRLVAQAFIPNPMNLPQVNHIDENKRNNCFENLEWCDNRYNNNYGTHRKNISIAMSKPVLCLETNTKFQSMSTAAEWLNVGESAISAAIHENRACKGFHFVRI